MAGTTARRRQHGCGGAGDLLSHKGEDVLTRDPSRGRATQAAGELQWRRLGRACDHGGCREMELGEREGRRPGRRRWIAGPASSHRRGAMVARSWAPDGEERGGWRQLGRWAEDGPPRDGDAEAGAQRLAASILEEPAMAASWEKRKT